MERSYFIWETHGVHVGTGRDHVKHGIDDVEQVIHEGIKRGYPALTFIIHTPRLTKIRYQSERNTDIKFIRGDESYFHYAQQMQTLKIKYQNQIDIRYGIELEWMGAGLGLQWNKAKVLQVPGADFVMGSVHFSHEGIAYDGSIEETRRLISLRGSLEAYWRGYIDEMIEMVTASRGMIQVVGHIDLLKLYTPFEEILEQLVDTTTELGQRYQTFLELISGYNLALDLNLAGLRKGCGIYPDLKILKRARELDIPVTIGTDTHKLSELGSDYDRAVEMLKEAGYRDYVSFANKIPEKRPFSEKKEVLEMYDVLNLAIEMINRRFDGGKNMGIPKFSFGGAYADFFQGYQTSSSLGDLQLIRVRKRDKVISLTDGKPEISQQQGMMLFSKHTNQPGTLLMLFNTLASEGINVDAAYLNGENREEATAYLTLNGDEERIRDAVSFVKGSGRERFFELKYDWMGLPHLVNAPVYLHDVDGVKLPFVIAPKMILSVHRNSSGILLILLSALGACNANVIDMQLGSRGEKGYAILAVEGNSDRIREALDQLGDEFDEITFFKPEHYQK